MESLANFIGREGFNWWVGQVENDGAKFWNADLDGGAGDFDYGDWEESCCSQSAPASRK